ncbi:MAG: hypothetical protein K9J13_08000 [Saprospiraceae bacterium]|nr:hypothetical protein [Saprospiraceae bacterium]
MNRKAYLKIIKNELEKIACNLYEITELQIVFDESIIELVYKEGVYPTQGVRPIFTSIHYLLKSNLSMFLSDILLKDIKPNKLKFTIQNKTLICFYHFEKSLIYEKQIAIKTTLEDMRINKQDDMQAITAVHESGHAILSAILLRTIPEVIFSITSDADNHGFIFSKFAWDYITRKELIPRVAMFLGGYVAEEIIFGKEYLTTGASSDIEKATEFLSYMYKKGGMGEIPISYNSSKNDNFSYHQNDSVEEEVKQSIELALELAQTTLKKERKLLLVMSDYLSDNRSLKKQEIEKLINANISNQMDFITNGELLYYRNHLKKAVGESKTQKSEMFHNAISLNKEK